MLPRTRHLLPLAALALWSCAEDSLGRVQPKIQVEPEQIDLGATPVGVLARHKVTITNIGAGVLTLSSIALVDEEGIPRSDDLSVELDVTLPHVLPGSAKLEIEVHHIPRDDVFDAGLLRITSDDPMRPKVDVEIVQSAAGAPKVEAVPDLAQADIEIDTTGALATTVSSIDFGMVLPGVAKAIELHVVNAGSGNVPLKIDSVSLAPGQTAPGLQVSAQPEPTAERTLLPRIGSDSRAAVKRSVKVILSWQPPSAGSNLAATLRITSNDTTRRELDIPITGSTSSAGPPILRLTPPAGVTFGSVPAGMTATQMFTAHNDGGSALVIEPLSIDTNPDNVFALVETPQQITIMPGSNYVYSATFSPIANGAYHGTVRIGSNDPARAGAVSYNLDGGGQMMCTPMTPDPGEPANDDCSTAISRGTLTLPMNSMQRTSWNDAMLYGTNDNDWSVVNLSVEGQDMGCFLVGYDINASAVLPGGEQAEICIHMGSCGAPESMRCGMSSARIFLLSGDDVCNAYSNNVPVYVRVRHTSGEPTCTGYTLNFTAR